MDMTLYHGRLRGVDCISSRRIDHRSQLSIIDGTLCTSNDTHVGGTVKNGRVLVDDELIRFEELRGDGLHLWDSEQVVGDPEEWQEIPWAIRVHQEGKRVWVVPTQDDMLRDQALTELVARSLEGWFDSGLIPESPISPGVGKPIGCLGSVVGRIGITSLLRGNCCNWFDSKKSFDPERELGKNVW